MCTPPEIIVQIFHALPLRALLRCNLVCKEWRSLISDPAFRSEYNNNANHPSPNDPLHLLLIPQPTKYLFCKNPKLPKVSVATHEIDTSGNCAVSHHASLSEYRYMDIVGSCNGLVALYGGTDYYQYPAQGEFYLFNPCTGKSKFVRVDIELDNYLYGLCYDPKNNDYKVVLPALGWSPEKSFTILVSFRDGLSKRKNGNLLAMTTTDDNSCDTCAVYDPNVGVVVNGIPHWAKRCVYSTHQSFIIAFDVEREEFKTVALPKGGVGREVSSVGMIRGKLSVGLYLGHGIDGMEVFVMEEYGNAESWNLVFATPRPIKMPLFMMKNCEVLVEQGYNNVALMRYNYKDDDSRQAKPKVNLKLNQVITYFPSLASPPP